MCAPPWVHPGRFHTVHVKKSPKDTKSLDIQHKVTQPIHGNKHYRMTQEMTLKKWLHFIRQSQCSILLSHAKGKAHNLSINKF